MFIDPSERVIENSNPCLMPSSPAVPKNSAHSDQANAASVPSEIRVSIVVAPCRRLTAAALWKGQPAYTTTGEASVSESHCHPSNWMAGIIAIAMTGTDRTTAVMSRCRTGRRASSGSGAASCAPSAARRGGSAAV